MEAQYAETKTEDNIRKAVDAWNRHDVNAIVALYSPDIVRYGPMHPEGSRGLAELRKQTEEAIGAFPDLRLKVSNILAKGDTAWFAWEATGTHKGAFQTPAGPVPPTNKVVKLRAAQFARTSRDLVVEEHSYFDLADLLRQLGMAQQK